MKLLMLHYASTSLCLKNKLKIFPSKETHDKGGQGLKWTIFRVICVLYGLVTYMQSSLSVKGKVQTIL